MKSLVIIFAVIYSAYAVPQDATRQSRFVDGIIASAIEDLSESIVESGLDPYHLDEAGVSYALPVPILFNAKANIKNVNFNGASNIIINDISWSLLRLRVDLDISLPQIYVSIDEAAAEATIFGKSITANVKGSVSIVKPRVSGWMTFSILGGLSLNNISLEFDLGGVFSLLDINILGQNFAAPMNKFVTHEVPAALQEFRAEINELVTIVAGHLIQQELSR